MPEIAESFVAKLVNGIHEIPGGYMHFFCEKGSGGGAPTPPPPSLKADSLGIQPL